MCDYLMHPAPPSHFGLDLESPNFLNSRFLSVLFTKKNRTAAGALSCFLNGVEIVSSKLHILAVLSVSNFYNVFIRLCNMASVMVPLEQLGKSPKSY